MIGASGFARALREAAPTLSRRYFSCQCPRITSQPTKLPAPNASKPSRIAAQASLRYSRSWQSQKVAISQLHATRSFTTSLKRCDAVELPQSGQQSKQSRFPKRSSNVVAYWLLGSAASVFGIVVFGGLTRLTESGLSITEWKPVTGSLPPMSEADWASEFFKYQSSPEFHLLNSRMTLEEFKSIYWMEWIHRIWGRAIGLTFVLPAIYFVARRQVSRSMSLRLLGIAGLIGFQGFLGWWMVKSGLKDDLFAPGSHPRVSQYRLTAHLGAAFIVYLTMLHNGLAILRTNRLLSLPASSASAELTSLRHPALRPFKIATLALTALVFTTAMSGGLVAGLDAGLIYNEFPYMGLGLTPPKAELFDKFYSHVPPDSAGEHSDLIWRNMLENPSLVQLDHRIMATTTFSAVMALAAYRRFSPAMIRYLPVPARKAVHGVVGFACLQVVLGITTLLYLVPTPVASAHQAGSLTLLSYCFVLGNRVWFPKAAAKLIEQRARLGVEAGTVRKVWEASSQRASNGARGTASEVGSGAGVVMAAAPLIALAGFFATTPRPPSTLQGASGQIDGNSAEDFKEGKMQYLQRQQTFKTPMSPRDL